MWLCVIYRVLLLVGAESVFAQQDASSSVMEDTNSSATPPMPSIDYSDENELFVNEPQMEANRSDMIEKIVRFEDRFNQTSIFVEFSDKSSKLVVSNCSLMLVNGTELSLLNVTRDWKSAHFEAIGALDDIGEEAIVDVQFISKNEFTLLLVALHRRYQVYVFGNDMFNGLLRPIEQIAQIGQHQRSILFSQGDTVYALIGNGVPNELGAASTIRIYKWRQSHFTKVLQQSIHWMRDIHLCQAADGTTVFVVVQTNWAEDVQVGSPDNTITLLEVFVFGQERWRHVQNLHIRSTQLYTFHMAGKCFLITAPAQRNGTTTEKYVWEVDGFRTVPQHQAVAFNYFVSTNNELALILNRNKLTAFPDADFKRGFTYEQNRYGDVNAMFLVDTNDQLTVGFVRVDRNVTAQSYHIQLLGVSVDAATGEVGAAAPVTWSSEDCFKDLGVAVVNRKQIIEQIGIAAQDVMQKDAPANQTVDFSTEITSMKSGIFAKIVLNVTSVTVTPVKLLKQIKDLKARIDSIKASRPKREIPSPPPPQPKLTTATVTRLYLNNSTNHIFRNVLLRGKQIHINAPIRVKSLDTNAIRILESSDGLVRASEDDSNTVETTTLKRVNRLVVRNVNGIDWNAFVQSVFMRNAPKNIKGNLIVTKPSIVNSLTTSSVNGHPIDTFVTVQTDQTISADVMFRNFLTMGITANTTNGIRFGEDVVLVDGDKYIETPVIVQKCTINTLQLADGDDSSTARHVVGTQLEDLSQIYSGKVIIRGSLRMENVVLEQPDIVTVGGQAFDVNVPSQYWMKSVEQSFASIRLTGLTRTSQIITELINSSPTSDYILRNLTPLQKVNLVIHTAVVRGSIFTDPAYKTTVVTISENCVLRQNAAVIRNGRKTFTGYLTVDSFNSMSGQSDYSDLNGMQRDQLLTNRNKLVFPCVKQFQQLTVFGQIQVTSESLKVARLNGFDLQAGMQNMARVNQAASLDEVLFSGNVGTASLSVEMIEQTPFAQVLAQLEAVVGDRGSIESVRIAGDVSFVGSLNVRVLNQIDLDSYLSLVVSKENPGAVVTGSKRFLGDVHVGQLDLQRLNEWNLAELVVNALHKNRAQTVTAEWQIAKLQVQHLLTPSINNVRTDQLVDTASQEVMIESDISFKSLEVSGKVISTESNCDLVVAMDAIQNGFRKTQWRFIEIDGLATWPTTDLTTPINHMLAFAVTTSTSQIITGDITFGAGAQINTITTTSTINGVDLTRLSKDALLGNSIQFQSISGEKVFRSSLQTGPILAHGDLAVPIINNCNIIAMNQSLFRSHSDRLITGTKLFRIPPSIYNLHTDNAPINGVLTSDIVTVSSTAPVPKIIMLTDIYVTANMVITDTLNAMPFTFFLEKRLRQFGEVQEVRGDLTFEHLIIHGHSSRLVTINNIPIEDVVLQTSDEDQMVSGRKRMLGTLSLDGPVAVTKVNGVDLVSTFLNTVWLDDNITIPRLTVFNNISLQKGMVVHEALNGADVMSVLYWHPPSAEDIQPIQREINKEIRRADVILHQSQSNTSNVYLDYAADVKIRYINQSDDGETFIVDTLVECDQCQCPSQNFVTITKYQVNILRRPPFERWIRLLGNSTNFTIKTVFEQPAHCPTTFKGPKPFAVLEWNGLALAIDDTNPIRDAKLFQQDQTTLLLVHLRNGTVNVRYFDAATNQWIMMPSFADGQSVNQIHVLSWNKNNILLAIFGANSGNMHGSAQLHSFNGHTFVPLYAHIPGDFDQCAWLDQQRRRQFMVWLGRSGSDVINVFKAVHQNGLLLNFEMLQTIILPNAMVKTLVPMQVQDSNYMAVVTQNSFLYLYRFNYLEGWVRATFGYFKDIETVVPFRYYQRDYLYVSMKTAATALVVHQRG